MPPAASSAAYPGRGCRGTGYVAGFGDQIKGAVCCASCFHSRFCAEAHMAAVGATPSGPVIAEDVRDLHHWTGHGWRRLRRRVLIPAFRTADSLLWAERCDSLLPEQLDSGAGMSAAIGLRQDFDAGTLRRMAAQVKDADQARRLLALAAVYDGMSREEAARIGGMDRQTMRDWVHRFNEHGADGLINVKPPGRPPKLSQEQKEELRCLVQAGPDPEKDGVVRWRCVDLKRVLGERFAV